MLQSKSASVTAVATPPLAELPPEYVQQKWYAVYTCARHEKRVADQLEHKSIETFLPLYETVRRWKDRRKHLELPLFPGYVFVRLALKDRLQVLEIPSVVRLVGFNGRPSSLPDLEMEALRNSLSRRLPLEPHPYLNTGVRVLVRSGPLQGLEGVLIRRRKRLRFVVSLHLIARSVTAEIDEADLQPIGGVATS